MQFIQALVLPQALLCGLVVSRNHMTPFLSWLSDVLPLSYAVDAMQRISGSAAWTSAITADVATSWPSPRRRWSAAHSPCAARPARVLARSRHTGTMPANRIPAADVDISAELVRSLLASQHPDIAALPVEFLANGWDDALFRLGSELVVRMPRPSSARRSSSTSSGGCHRSAPRLPLPVPYPERTGHSAVRYPYSWSVVPYIPGTPAASEEPGTLTRRPWRPPSAAPWRAARARAAGRRANPFRGGPLGRARA